MRGQCKVVNISENILCFNVFKKIVEKLIYFFGKHLICFSARNKMVVQNNRNKLIIARIYTIVHTRHI